MSREIHLSPFTVTGLSGVAGLLVLLVLLFVLSFVQRNEAQELEVNALDIRSIEIPNPTEDSETVATTAASQTESVKQLPTRPLRLPSLTVEPLPLDLKVDVSQVLEQRDTLDYIMSQRDLMGAFGSVRLEGTDTVPRSIYIPPNRFPKVLRDRGIYSGDVLFILEISEQGIASVRQVVEADYLELIDPVVMSIEGAIYSRPLRHGKPTRTIIKSLIHFRSGPAGESMQMEVQGSRQGGNR